MLGKWTVVTGALWLAGNGSGSRAVLQAMISDNKAEGNSETTRGWPAVNIGKGGQIHETRSKVALVTGHREDSERQAPWRWLRKVQTSLRLISGKM